MYVSVCRLLHLNSVAVRYSWRLQEKSAIKARINSREQQTWTWSEDTDVSPVGSGLMYAAADAGLM